MAVLMASITGQRWQNYTLVQTQGQSNLLSDTYVL